MVTARSNEANSLVTVLVESQNVCDWFEIFEAYLCGRSAAGLGVLLAPSFTLVLAPSRCPGAAIFGSDGG